MQSRTYESRRRKTTSTRPIKAATAEQCIRAPVHKNDLWLRNPARFARVSMKRPASQLGFLLPTAAAASFASAPFHTEASSRHTRAGVIPRGSISSGQGSPVLVRPSVERGRGPPGWIPKLLTAFASSRVCCSRMAVSLASGEAKTGPLAAPCTRPSACWPTPCALHTSTRFVMTHC